jgi:hypothetical protein
MQLCCGEAAPRERRARSSQHRSFRVALFLLVWALGASAVVRAQSDSDPIDPGQTEPERLDQDALDFLGRSVIVGSGARAFGMGGAFLARADDATAASWNPAGLSYLRRPEVSLVWQSNSFRQTQATLDDDRSGGAPDFLALAYPMSVKNAQGAVQLSYQRVVSFDGERTIEQDFQTREFRYDGGFDVLALGAGFQLSRRLRLGATLNRWFNGYHQTLRREGGERPALQQFDYEISGWNANLGLMFTFGESFNVGFVGKTPVTWDVTLDRSRIDFGPSGSPESQSPGNSFRSDNVELDYPGAFGFGISWRARSTLTLSADFTRSNWSAGRIRNFFTLPPTGEPTKDSGDLFDDLPYPDLTVEEQGHQQADAEQLRVGIEYVVVGDQIKVPLRAGYFNDRQVFRSGSGAAPRFDGLSVGVGIIVGPVLLDLAYTYERGSYLGRSSDVNEPGAPISVKLRSFHASLIFRKNGGS